MDQSVSLDLCNILTGIDGINIGTYEISCFELVSGHSFEDSTAIVPPTTTGVINKTLGKKDREKANNLFQQTSI